MTDDYKKRVQSALDKFALKQLPKAAKTRANKNKAPEQLVQRECLVWLRAQGFDVYVVESKATFSQASQSYRSSSAMPGFSDIVGCDDNGVFLAIELKAKGRLSTLKEHQRKFLVEKISRGGFGVCVDSVELLKTLYQKWSGIAGQVSKQFLLDSLPPQKVSQDTDLF